MAQKLRTLRVGLIRRELSRGSCGASIETGCNITGSATTEMEASVQYDRNPLANDRTPISVGASASFFLAQRYWDASCIGIYLTYVFFELQTTDSRQTAAS